MDNNDNLEQFVEIEPRYKGLRMDIQNMCLRGTPELCGYMVYRTWNVVTPKNNDRIPIDEIDAFCADLTSRGIGFRIMSGME